MKEAAERSPAGKGGKLADRMSTRRAILAGAGALAMTGWASGNQRAYRLGFLTVNAPDDRSPYRGAFLGRLAELGYREGQNLVIDTRFAEGAKHQTEWRYEPGDSTAQ